MRSARLASACLLLLALSAAPASAAKPVPGAAATVRATDLPGAHWVSTPPPASAKPYDPAMDRCLGITAIDAKTQFARGPQWSRPTAGGRAYVESNAAVVGKAKATTLAAQFSRRLARCADTVQRKALVTTLPVDKAATTLTVLHLAAAAHTMVVAVRVAAPFRAPLGGVAYLDTIVVTGAAAQARVTISSTNAPWTKAQLTRLAKRVGARLPAG